MSQTNPCERGVIHLAGARGSSAMFEMARRAALNIRVKRGRLPLKNSAAIGPRLLCFYRVRFVARVL
ncbi:MAG: hypothetical protein DME85_13960 [Verrucomicrobia bacterium]|nr:MAG: hypothetical protein DME85_13960 [Verrucomicrobiota bacterium]